MKKIIAVAVALSLVPVAALASEKKDKSADMGDSSRIICEKVKLTGSRLAVKKTCHTAAEWADIRRQQRDNTTRIQSAVPRPGE
ncbi:hypothetical protein [Sphingosinicella humi]|uniref:Uncharacterized protein n=1 Tax=Allosphingosinicella humi TaxID=2068657 RepID=A0A2U2J4W4_9SPHN|nr:hypothetical protein [Sphingosinicella humi]PWG03321.1 hypothetical protein DF286_10915 [Sphingosinicella humi]